MLLCRLKVAYRLCTCKCKVVKKIIKNKIKSDARMTASVVKQDTSIKRSKERYLLGQKHSLQIFGVIPIIRLQNDT